MALYLGCPVWSFKGWVGNFYPAGTRLTGFLREYARRLNSIEGNTTFYAVPAAKTLETWIEQTPGSFHFCLKIPKGISHERDLAGGVDRTMGFVSAVRPLASRLGPMFLQLPPGFSPRLIPELATFLSAFPRDVRLGVEVRHLDWFEDEHRNKLNELLADHNMARVVIDTRPIRTLTGDESIRGSAYESLLEARERKPNVPVFEEITADFTFLRFIGHPNMEQNLPFIREWAARAVDQLVAGKDAYIFCHSPDNLLAPFIAREFHRQISSRVEVVPLPWDHIQDDTPRQATLF